MDTNTVTNLIANTNLITNNITNSVSSDSFKSIIIETLKSAQSVGSEVYDTTKHFGKSAIDFLQTQIPEVLESICHYEFYYHLIWLIVPILAILAIWLLRYVIVRKCLKEMECGFDKTATQVISYIVCFFISLGTIFPPSHNGGPINQALTCIKIKTAPKLFLIEYVNGIVSGKNAHNH